MFLASTIFIHVNEMIQFLYLDVSMVIKYQYLFEFKGNNESLSKYIPDYKSECIIISSSSAILIIPMTTLLAPQ